MTRNDLIYTVSAIATVIGITATSIATSGQFDPATSAIVMAIATGATGLVTFLAKPRT
jgi:hypothetical protein